jgi:hypothetical protein
MLAAFKKPFCGSSRGLFKLLSTAGYLSSRLTAASNKIKHIGKFVHVFIEVEKISLISVKSNYSHLQIKKPWIVDVHCRDF